MDEKLTPYQTMSFQEKIFIALQHILPQHGLSRLMGRITHCTQPWVKNTLMRQISKAYGINLEEASESDFNHYPHFNAFFTRALKEGARTIDLDPNHFVSPADGAISQMGPILGDSILQAKGRDYTVLDLLGGDTQRAKQFENGQFATIYLSPKDYHRLHMPISGDLTQMVHVPGKLFSVNDATARGVPRLFARNERVIAYFETPYGPMALILVGAIFVASIETVWHGVVTPPTQTQIQSWDYTKGEYTLQKGEEMGRFNMGSTIIVLLGKDAITWSQSLQSGSPVRLGETLGIKASV